MNLRSAIQAINERGILLVYPIKNEKEPASLWSHFFPRAKMRWEWDDSGDNRVAELWHLREELARSRKVAYAKWYQGRATFFSHELFAAMLGAFASHQGEAGLRPDSWTVLSLLLERSPLSTKQLKKEARLEGRLLEATYNRALKDLWSRLLIVGVGEVDDGAFPSLAVGATQILFEDLWAKSLDLSASKARALADALLGKQPLFHRHYQRTLKTLERPSPTTRPKILYGWGLGPDSK